MSVAAAVVIAFVAAVLSVLASCVSFRRLLKCVFAPIPLTLVSSFYHFYFLSSSSSSPTLFPRLHPLPLPLSSSPSILTGGR